MTLVSPRDSVSHRDPYPVSPRGTRDLMCPRGYEKTRNNTEPRDKLGDTGPEKSRGDTELRLDTKSRGDTGS